MHYIIALLLLSLPAAEWKGLEKIPLPAVEAEAVVDSIGREYYNAKFALYPEYATAAGAHEFDRDLATLAPGQVSAFMRRLGRLEQTLGSFHEDSLSMQGWIDLMALSADMATQRFILEDLDLWHRSAKLYSDACINGIYYLLIRPDTPDLNEALEARLSGIPDVVAQARKNLTRPIRLHCEVASTNLKDFALFLDGLRPPAESAIAVDPALLDQAARSLDGFAAYLDSVAPGADPAYELGRANLEALLRTKHMIETPLEELLSYAELVLDEAEAMRAEGARRQLAKSDGAEADTLEAAELGREDIVRHLYAEVESARAFVRSRDLVTLPDDEELEIVETPGFLRSLVPGYAYMPAAPLDRDPTGLFYAPLPTVMDPEVQRRYARDIRERRFGVVTTHEAFPGHHVQITTANRIPSYIRRLQDNMFTIEGWAFYCEEMMAQEGYYGEGGMDKVAGGIVFRAARVIVDIRLQTGEFSLDEAVDFMVIKTGAPRDFILREVRRYAVEPTQAMSYLIGKREIDRLRNEVRSTLGDSFTLKSFHDTILSCGSLPLRLLGTCVMSKTMGRM